MLVGVSERVTADGLRVADGSKGVDSVDGFKEWAEQAIRNHLAPATFSRFMDPIVLAEGKVIVAINVPPSLHLVALWHQDRSRGIEYLYRTDHGKQWMNPDEIERHLMNGSRAVAIALNDVLEEVLRPGENSAPVELTPPLEPLTIGRSFVRGMVTLHRPGCSNRVIELRVELAGTLASVYVSHGLIIEVWPAGNGRVGLCLKVAVVARGERDVRLEPFTALA